MDSLRRLTMNTSLKNARIFDEEVSDEESSDRQIEIKKEPETDYDYDPGKNNTFSDIIVKKEPKLEASMEDGEIRDDDQDTKALTAISQPKIKLGDSSNEAEELNNFKDETTLSPETVIKQENVDGMFDESPYNKELFDRWKIKDVTPVKTESDEPQTSNLKSAKRSVFTRPSPYKIEESTQRSSIRNRLGPKIDETSDMTTRKRPEKVMETDHSVLARREKQIEYGKNTVGYENYVDIVPRKERKPEDPKTPPKYGKYSRRAWEGLIKQWRIKLHKYDPPENQS